MDGHNRQEQSDTSEDEDQNFASYMDENGVIGLEGEGLELENTQVLGEEEDVGQFLDLDRREMELDEGGLLFPDSPSEGDRSDAQNWEGQFSFSDALEKKRNNHLTGRNTTGQRPPGRDWQLDMTEDEVDHGSSLGAWEGDEPENWDEKPTDFLHNERLQEYDQTSAGEDQWQNLPRSPAEDYSEMSGNQESEALAESILPSSPPVPSTWNTRLVDMLSLSAGIADETFPESLHTDSGDGSAAVPSGDHPDGSSIAKVSSQTRTLRTKHTPSPSTPPRMENAPPSSVKRGKSNNIAQYGRGQLNYPLPDFSKVGPRVRFPRDEESYRPPQPRRQENQNKGAPALFKSPAEIVREVLLSSTEKPSQDPIVPPTVPQEFKTPQQATVLVHQLQEDYHKLLTKYAEAENTIDRLRLGAKVQLYSDSAKPSQSVQMGMVMQGSKVMEFTIPHAQMATYSSIIEDKVVTEMDTGSSAPLKYSVTPPDDSLPATSGSSSLQPPENVHSTLRSHLESLYREVDLFDGLLHDGKLTPEEQRQAVQKLRGSLDLLERSYLQAQEQYRQEQHRTGRASQELDPQRELEEAIFQMGVQLDDLLERVENSARPTSSMDTRITAHHFDNAPVPLELVPIPTTQTPYPQVTSPELPRLSGTSMGPADKEDLEEYLPQPLRHKHMQLEKDYGTLLSTYSSFKSLPDALVLEQEEWPQQLPQNVRPHVQLQDDSTQGHYQASKPQDPTQATRPLDLITPVSSQSHQDNVKSVSSQDPQLATKTRQSSPRSTQQVHSKVDTPQSISPTESPKHNINESSPSNRTSVPTTPSPTEQRRASSVLTRHSTAPGEGRTSALRRISQASKTFPQRVSMSSSLPLLKEQSPRTPTKELSASEESISASQSRKSSIGIKSSSPLGLNKSSAIKGSSAQRRILSPETDSGFLGSESGQSLLLHKRRHQLSQNREEPLATPSSSNSPMRKERRLPKNTGESFSRNDKGSCENTKQNNPWTGLSEGSSPSPGPKSLTESDSREESQTDESDLERERSSNVIGDASLLLSPIDVPSQPLENILESRAARDQAIHNLQNEVIHLRHHLESSLSRSPTRRKLGKPSIIQNQRDERTPRFSHSSQSPVSRLGVPPHNSRAEHGWRRPVSHDRDYDHDPLHHSAEKGSVRGAYTGTHYQVLDPQPLQTTESVTAPHCQRCQEHDRKKHVTMKTPTEDDSPPPTHPTCPLCHGKRSSDKTQKSEVTHGEHNRRRHRRRCGCQHWFMSQPPPVSCAHSPLVPCSPVMYSPSPGVYAPVGYTVADLRSSFYAAPPSGADMLQVDDLSYPLSRALQAAKELKVTSKRMCRSLIMDLSTQRSLRSSCLF